MANSAVALNLLQSPNSKCIEPPLQKTQKKKKNLKQRNQNLKDASNEEIRNYYQISFNHVIGDFVTNCNELFLRHVFGDFVLHFEINEDLASSCAPNSMNILKRVLNPLVVWNLDTSNTSALNAQTGILRTTPFNQN